MPVFVLGKVELDDYQRAVINVSSIMAEYRHLLSGELEATCFILKEYSPEGKVTGEPRALEIFKIISTYNQTLRVQEYELDLSEFVNSHGTPIGRSIELILLTFTKNNGLKRFTAQVYPGEVRQSVSPTSSYEAQRFIQYDVAAYSEIANSYGLALLISSSKFKRVGSNLLDGLSRWNNSDFGGAVMAFRKSIEALRDYIKGVDENEYPERRVEQLKGYASGSIGLLSNFGLHAPANAGPDEAKFSRRVAIAFVEYVVKNLEEKNERKAK